MRGHGVWGWRMGVGLIWNIAERMCQTLSISSITAEGAIIVCHHKRRGPLRRSRGTISVFVRCNFLLVITKKLLLVITKNSNFTTTEIVVQASNIRQEERGENFTASSGACIRRNKPKTAFRVKELICKLAQAYLDRVRSLCVS